MHVPALSLGVLYIFAVLPVAIAAASTPPSSRRCTRYGSGL